MLFTISTAAYNLDLIQGGFSSTWSSASYIHCPWLQRQFGSTLGIGKVTGHFTILTHIWGYSLNQAICSVKELIPSQCVKGLNVEQRKHYPDKKTKRNQIIPSPTPFFHSVDPSLVEFVVTSEHNSKLKLEITALRMSEHISSLERHVPGV